jgi:hypothetical protein
LRSATVVCWRRCKPAQGDPDPEVRKGIRIALQQIEGLPL